jgi:hypothetical protein
MAWLDLIKQILGKDDEKRLTFRYILYDIFPNIPDRQLAWNDFINFIKLTQDDELHWIAAHAICSFFPSIPDKQSAWRDIIWLIQMDGRYIQGWATYTLRFIFPSVPDKQQAWQDLHRLTKDKDRDVRGWAAYALGSAFPYISDKQQVWHDLQRLIEDEDSFVKWGTANALGSAFPYIPDKQQAWRDLMWLANDNDQDVRCIANYALGRASIFNATEAESNEGFKAQLEMAIQFFDYARMDVTTVDPAAFCLPFYKSLYSLLFAAISKEAEVQKYLDEARYAVNHSESGSASNRVVLLEAVENLSKALLEVKSYTVEDVILRRQELKSYMKYCLNVADNLNKVRKEAPFASKVIDLVAVKKGIPFIDDKIKILFKHVEDAAKSFCKESSGTNQEGLGRSTYEIVRGLKKADTLIEAEGYFIKIIPLLKAHCDRLPKEAQGYLKDLLKSMESFTLEERFTALEKILMAALVQGGNEDRQRKEQEEFLNLLKNIEFTTLNLSLSSGDIKHSLFKLHSDIRKFQDVIDVQGTNLGKIDIILNERNQVEVERLEKMRNDLLNSIENIAQRHTNDEGIKKILEEVQDMKRLKTKELVGVLSDIIQIGSYANWLLEAIPSWMLK